MDKEIPSERFMDKVAAAYVVKSFGKQRNKELHPTFMELAIAFNTSNVRIRRILITKGLYSTAAIQNVIKLRKQGRSIEEIGKVLGLRPSSVKANLPYEKGLYNINEKTDLGKRVDKSRKRSRAVKKLKNKLACNDCKTIDELVYEKCIDELWNCIVLFQNYTFRTSGRNGSGAVKFEYVIKESHRTGKLTDELVFNRKENSKTITKSTIKMAFINALKEQNSEGYVKGPKKLKVFGASYLYSMFLRFGIITSEVKEG